MRATHTSQPRGGGLAIAEFQHPDRRVSRGSAALLVIAAACALATVLFGIWMMQYTQF